jgi:thioredoxin reductase
MAALGQCPLTSLHRYRDGEKLFETGDCDFNFFVVKNGEVEKDAKDFVRTGMALAKSQHWTRQRQPFLLETSRPGVFAAGDVRSGSVKRVASAVGEGAMAVQFVHEYLNEI